MADTPTLSITSLGTGSKTIVFLHGLMGRGKNFTAIAKNLEQDFTILLIDLPNHGNSPWTESFDYNNMADSVAQAICAYHGEPAPVVDVVGHSMGGKVAMLLALRHPELVRKLVVLDIAPSASNGNFTHLLGSLLKLPIEEFSTRAEAHRMLTPAVPDSSVRGFLLQNLIRTEEGFSWQPNLQMLFENLPKIMGWQNPNLSFNRPVLWIAGGRSPYITSKDTPVMRSLFPRVQKVVFKNAGHWVHADQPEETVYALKKFLAQS
ncbi:alpha/beta fold hydrolase [Rothia sp. P6271]|uniref:alpha/beta fold hydrolase n=1 Tax=Rothia sp. P6271 TaxID=3402659 RepID=UPI003AC167D2